MKENSFPHTLIGRFVHLAKSDQEKFLRSFFQKSAEPTSNQRTMFAQTQMESFWSSFFQKTCGVKRGRAPEKTALFFLQIYNAIGIFVTNLVIQRSILPVGACRPFAPLVSKEKAIERRRCHCQSTYNVHSLFF